MLLLERGMDTNALGERMYTLAERLYRRKSDIVKRNWAGGTHARLLRSAPTPSLLRKFHY